MEQGQSMELADVADSASSCTARGERMLEALRRIVPFDAAWLAVTDPMEGRTYTSLASTDLDEGTLRYLAGPTVTQDIEATQTDRPRPPTSPSDLRYPVSDLPTWAECFLPAGFREALGVALFTRGQRHVGFLVLLSNDPQPPSLTMRRRLHQLAPVLARGIDPLRSLAVAARVVRGATAGAVLRLDGATRPLPGLDGDCLLADGSVLVDFARSCLGDGRPFTSFLWPRGGGHAPEGHVRASVLASGEEPSTGLLGAVVLSDANDLRGLTPRELEVLGLLIDGRSNHQIAQELVVAPRTVATHLEHILAKLSAPTRTLAAVRAERDGLYVPAAHLRQAHAPATDPGSSPG
jgi:DNA-binding CsgD family transcriptional regulator